MPFNALLTPHRATHDEEDQIGSTSSTPPGASTPRPDPQDKRQPSILQSYFGQVRDSLMLPRRKSAVNPSPTSAHSQDRPESIQEEKESTSHPQMLPSPTPSTSSRAPSTSLLAAEAEKLTEGAYAPPQNQATPPQTPRTRSHESKPKPSSLSRTSNVSEQSKDKDKENKSTPVVGPPKGKLAITISEGRGLRPSVDPYVVCQFQWAEYISDGPRHDEKKGRPSAVQMKRTESEFGRPMAIPMKSRQSSNSGYSSDPREGGSAEEVTNPKWEHEAILYVHSQLAEKPVTNSIAATSSVTMPN